MVMVGVDAAANIGRLTVKVVLLGLRVGGRLAPFYIHEMNSVKSRNGSVTMTAS